MNDWTPGPGWREVQYGAELSGYEHITWDSTGLAGGVGRMWVREAPMPPLPTTPHTVIRAWWGTEASTVLVLSGLLIWVSLLGSEYRDRHLADLVRFEVLAEPRAVTAKAVLDRITNFLDAAWTPGHLRVLSYDIQKTMFDNVCETFGINP